MDFVDWLSGPEERFNQDSGGSIDGRGYSWVELQVPRGQMRAP